MGYVYLCMNSTQSTAKCQVWPLENTSQDVLTIPILVQSIYNGLTSNKLQQKGFLMLLVDWTPRNIISKTYQKSDRGENGTLA